MTIISLFNSPKICFEPLDKDWRKVEAIYLLNFEHHLLKNVQRFHSFKVNEILNLKLYLRNDFLLCIKIIWNRHGHECSRIWKLSGNFTLIQCIKKCRDFLGRDILGTTFFRAESWAVVPLLELSFLTKSQKLTST